MRERKGEISGQMNKERLSEKVVTNRFKEKRNRLFKHN